MTHIKAKNGIKNLKESIFVHLLGVNRDRCFFEIFNPSMDGVYINLNSLDGCALGTGVFIPPKRSWRMNGDCYVGDICAMGTNDVQTITYIEF